MKRQLNIIASFLFFTLIGSVLLLAAPRIVEIWAPATAYIPVDVALPEAETGLLNGEATQN